MLPWERWKRTARRSLWLLVLHGLCLPAAVWSQTTNGPVLKPAGGLPAPQPFPNTGRLAHDYKREEADAYVMIHNENPRQHLLVRFEDAATKKFVASVFIREGAQYSISNQIVLPPAEYRVKMATGMNWYGPEAAFGPEGRYSELSQTIRAESYVRMNLHLQATAQGGQRGEALSWRQFNTNAAAPPKP